MSARSEALWFGSISLFYVPIFAYLTCARFVDGECVTATLCSVMLVVHSAMLYLWICRLPNICQCCKKRIDNANICKSCAERIGH